MAIRSRYLVAFAAVLACGSPPSLAEHRFAVAGLTQEQVANFLDELQAAVRASEAERVCRLAQFPLPVHSAQPFEVRSSSDCVLNYERIFTTTVRGAILSQEVEDLFANWRGVMVGSGELWFSGICGEPSPHDACPLVAVRTIAINQ